MTHAIRGALVLLFLLAAAGAHAQSDLLKQVQDGNRAAQQLNQQREKRFEQQRDEQARQLKELQAQLHQADARVASAKQRWTSAQRAAAAMERKLEEQSKDLDALFDAARGAAVDLHDRAMHSPVTAQFPKRLEGMAPLVTSTGRPGPKELEALWQALQQEAEQGGQVARFNAKVLGDSGAAQREVTRIGEFTVFAGEEFFTLDPTGTAVQPLPRPASRHYRGVMRDFNEAAPGSVDAVIDPSGGPLMFADAIRPGLFERLWQSGVGGYFIAATMLIALGLIVVQSAWLRSRLILDEQSIGVVVGMLVLFAIVQLWLWSPGESGAQQENVATVDLVEEQPPAPPDEPPPPPEMKPPPPPPNTPTESPQALAGLPAMAAPTAAPLMSNINLPVKIAGGGKLTGQGFGGFATGTGTGAGTYGSGGGWSGKPLVPLSTARPQMPEWACKQNIKGWVEAVFTVMPNGRVQNVRIINAEPKGVYEVAAIQSISNWIYAEYPKAREVKQKVPMDPEDCVYNWQ